jgi:predicted RNase H-like nuclease (RuvC/YqgF family)
MKSLSFGRRPSEEWIQKKLAQAELVRLVRSVFPDASVTTEEISDTKAADLGLETPGLWDSEENRNIRARNQVISDCRRTAAEWEEETRDLAASIKAVKEQKEAVIQAILAAGRSGPGWKERIDAILAQTGGGLACDLAALYSGQRRKVVDEPF